MPKQKSPAPKKSEQFIVFVCQLPLSSHSKSHSIPTSPGLAGLCMQAALMSFSETSWVCTMGFAQISPTPPPQQPWTESFFLCHWCVPSHRGDCSRQGFLGVEGIPVPHKIHFLHRYFCSKTKLGMYGVQLVTKPPFKTWAGRNNVWMLQVPPP